MQFSNTTVTSMALLLALTTRQTAAFTARNIKTMPMKSILRAAASSSSTEASAAPSDAMINGRMSRHTLSLDVKTIVSETDMVLSHLKSRRASEETMDAARTIASLQSKRVELIQQRDDWLNRRKEASAKVGQLLRRSNDEADQEQVEQQKALSNTAAEEASKVEVELDTIQSTMDELLAGIPNLLDDQVPDGEDDTQNEEVLKWGDVEALPAKLEWTEDFEPKWHDDVAAGLNGYQSEAAVKMSGARFVSLSGPIARLERALAMFFIDLHTTKHGYTEVSVPFVVGRSALQGTSQLPKFEEDLFAITNESHTCNGEDAFLIPTAEVPLTNMHADSILEEADLPISYVAWTPCFRAEAGSYGRDTRGLIRTHQFHKVELVKITTPDTSDEQHELLTTHAEACLRALELPYRKVRLCSGDIGFSARHCYDLEVWLPGAKEYREISSCSNTGDFQARRMGLRYRPEAPPAEEGGDQKKKKQKKPKPELCHSINGSGLAVGRALVAVLENYQRPDGSVVVPEVLRPYMGGLEILEV
jgi:seryl-tRNA synthetase